MSETSYEQCHTSYRGYMDEEIDIAHEVLRKYGKPCSDAVKELRLKTNMPLSECGIMLRCLWRDIELEHVQSKNTKLWKLVLDMMQFFEDGDWCDKCSYARECDSQEQYEDDCLMRLVFRDRIEQLRMEVDRG